MSRDSDSGIRGDPDLRHLPDDEPPEACSDVGTHVLTRVLVFLELSGKNTQSCHSSQ